MVPEIPNPCLQAHKSALLGIVDRVHVERELCPVAIYLDQTEDLECASRRLCCVWLESLLEVLAEIVQVKCKILRVRQSEANFTAS